MQARRAIATMPAHRRPARLPRPGGLFPGCEQWVLDAYPPVLVLTSFAPASDAELETIGAALQAERLRPQAIPLNWVFQHRGEALRIEGRNETRPDGRCRARPQEAGVRYRVHVLRGQNRVPCRHGPPRMQPLRADVCVCVFRWVALQAWVEQVVNALPPGAQDRFCHTASIRWV